MTMNDKRHRPLFLAACGALSLLAACAEVEPGSPAPTSTAPASEAKVVVSPTALKVEEAERILDRGGDAAQAKALLDEALADSQLTAEERIAAVVAMSRVHEAQGRMEQAIAIVEQELAAHVEDRHSPDRLRKRLRDLLTDDDDRPRYLAEERGPAPPFAQMLSRYFPADDKGHTNVLVYVVGGDRSVREEVGTFNVGDGMRAEMEDKCPLCDIHLSVHNSVHAGDWVMIPTTRQQFGDALVVLYYDLEHNRIPARYASLLPMPLAELNRALEEGRSLAVATERNGAPPVVLLAAPRSAMLGDVERELAQLSELPTEPHFFEVANKIRPNEIRSIVRGTWIPEVRACYETLRQASPEAAGRLVTSFAIGGDGSVSDVTVESDDAALEVGSFLSCVESTAGKLTFPAIGGTTTVSYPLVFTPE